MIKTLILFVFSSLYCSLTFSQDTQFDSSRAAKLKADAYGMKSYTLVILKTGSATVNDKKVRDSIFHGHMNNIQKLAAEGKLVVAGPLSKNDNNYEGIFVFNTADVEETKKYLNTDPAILAKLLDADVYVWYSSAALQEIPGIHQKIQAKKF